VHLTVRTDAALSPDSDTYVNAYLQACAAESSGTTCVTNNWWVKDWFAFTYSGTQAWDNGTPHCTSSGTPVTWCSYVDNGTSTLQEGFNFGSNGYARMDISGNGQDCDVRTNSYSVPDGEYYYQGIDYNTCDGSEIRG
jgi:hypothetical protein